MVLPCIFVADGITTLFLMADVIAIMADGIAMYRLECKADLIAFVVDGITTGSYLSLSFMLFIRTSSHTCGRWYFLVQGWIIDPNEHWFLYQPGEVLLFPAHYTEVVDVVSVTSGVTMVMYRRGGL